jgi:hypothetical protein
MLRGPEGGAAKHDGAVLGLSAFVMLSAAKHLSAGLREVEAAQ